MSRLYVSVSVVTSTSTTRTPTSTTATPTSTTATAATRTLSDGNSTTTTVAAVSSAPSQPSSTMSASPAQDTGGSVQTVFYGLALLGLLTAIIYTVHMVRQDRRRRRLEQENPESGNRRTRHTATYRPEDNDAVCPPPQYRSYALDQVYVEPEMSTVYPDEAHHLGHRRGLSESESMSSRQDLINDAGTTELYELSESTAEGSRQPTTAATTTTMTTATNSPPQSPSPQSITTPNAAEQDGEPSATSSNASTSTVSAPPRPRQTSISMVEQIGNIRPGIFEPILSRIRSRSLGPPPYIPTASEDALPRLPPEYATAVSD